MGDVIKLPRRKKRAPTGEIPIMLAIISAVTRLPWCNIWRRNAGALRDENGRLVRMAEQGTADLLLNVECQWTTRLPGEPPPIISSPIIGRFTVLEVKRPGEKPTDDQARYLDTIRARGGFGAVVTSVAEALDAVERARDPRKRA